MKKTKTSAKKAKVGGRRFASSQLLFVFLFGVIGCVVIWRSFAAAPNHTTSSSFSLISDRLVPNPNPSAPTWCLNEDDYHHRDLTGTLNGTYTATEQLCDGNKDLSGGQYWTAGGIGLQTDLVATGTLNDLSITSPTGETHHAVLVETFTSGKGANKKTINHYEACFVPPYSKSTDQGTDPLAGGIWTITLSGNVSPVPYTGGSGGLSYAGGFSVTAEMAYTQFQQTYCPPSEQNLTP